MTEEMVFYMRAPARPDAVGAFSAETVKNFSVVLELRDDQVVAVDHCLQESPSFFDTETVTKLLQTVLQDEGQSTRLVSVLEYHARRKQISKETPEKFLEKLKEWLPSQKEVSFSNEQLDLFAKRLPILLKEYGGFFRQAKADRVSTATGQPFESVDILCDLRPVFDESRSLVEGIIPRTTIRIQAKGPDGFPRYFETDLSPKQLSALRKKIDDAEKKLRALGGIIESISVPIPSIDLTAKEPDLAVKEEVEGDEND